jgi:hypothetical protein
MNLTRTLAGAYRATLLVVVACSCGASKSEPQDGAGGNAGSHAGQSAAGDGGTSDGGQSGADGAGSAGLAEAGAGGHGGATSNAFPCGTTTPVIDASTGLEQCSGGYVRRSGPAECPSLLPRADAVSGYNAAIDECEFDAECAAEDSPYAHCGIRQGGFAHVCVDGCVVDADCDEGSVCRCGDPVGRCVPSTCSTGADCAHGFECAEYQAHPGCFSSEFACQTPADTCASDVDCEDFSPNPSFCRSEDGIRRCTITQCTTP